MPINSVCVSNILLNKKTWHDLLLRINLLKSLYHISIIWTWQPNDLKPIVCPKNHDNIFVLITFFCFKITTNAILSFFGLNIGLKSSGSHVDHMIEIWYNGFREKENVIPTDYFPTYKWISLTMSCIIVWKRKKK